MMSRQLPGGPIQGSPKPEVQLRFKAVSVVACTLMHELSQPLATANNYLMAATNLAKRRDDAAELCDAIAGSTQAVRNAVEMLRGIKAFVAGDDIQKVTWALSDLIERASAQATRKDCAHELKIDIEPGAQTVAVDRILMELVLSNLLKNAVEAGEP